MLVALFRWHLIRDNGAHGVYVQCFLLLCHWLWTLAPWSPHPVLATAVVQVLVVHMQYFIIINRINIPWPRSVMALQSAMAAVTGSVSPRSLALSCIAHQPDSSLQARYRVLAAFILPIIYVVLSLLAWAAR